MSTTLPQVHVAMIGVGNMGGAVLAGMRRAGFPADHIHAVIRRPERAAVVATDLGITPTADTEAAVRASRVVIIGVKPKDVLALLEQISPWLANDAIVVSLAAGLTTQTLAAHLPAHVSIVRTMPNTPAMVGEGVTLITPAAGCPEADAAIVDALLATNGQTVRITEDLQDAATTISGCGPAYFFAIVEALMDGGVALGLDRDAARALAVQTLVGAGQLLAQTDEEPARLRENVTSPGGMTAAALAVLNERGLADAFADAMRAARDRARDLANS